MNKEVWSLVQNLAAGTIGYTIAGQFVGAHAVWVCVGCNVGVALAWALVGGIYKKASA